MSKRRRMFDIDLPEDNEAPAPPPVLDARGSTASRRGPMATAIGENADALRRRAEVEAEIRAENDALAHEFVRLKRLGLVVDRIPVGQVSISRLVRDRSRTADLDLQDLKRSIRAIGLSNPIRVVADGQGGYELIQGLRRLTAYRELLEETGEEDYATIPAGLIAGGETMETLYRRMVDENLIRKDVSFAEMANLARAYAEEGVGDVSDLNEAVNLLYASAPPQKRSYIRRFAFLMRELDGILEHPTAIPRALGLQLADRIEHDPMALRSLVSALEDAERRSEAEELDILRRFLSEQSEPLPAKSRGAPKGGRRGRVSLAVPYGPGVRCTATQGKMELRAEMDFAAVDQSRLEAAIRAFFQALERT